MQKIILIIIISNFNMFCFSQNNNQLPIKEDYDNLFYPYGFSVKDLKDYIGHDCNSRPQISFSARFGDRTNYIMISLLRMYQATGDKDYLYKFVNFSILIEQLRNDRCGGWDNDPNTIFPGWWRVNTSAYHDHGVMTAMAEFVYIIKKDNNLNKQT